jgi:RNA polymerase sigma-70 factor (ECF subfamily)
LPVEGINERDLILKARSGDGAAQETLVRLYERKVFGLIVRMVGDREAGRDVLQDTFVKALTHLNQYSPGRSFQAWLFRIAANTAKDFLRRRRLEGRYMTYEDELPLERLSGGPEPADVAVARKLTWEAVERSMESLPPRYRSVLHLRYREGLAYGEIAETLSLPMGTVKALLHRGRRELKRLVRKEVGEE